MNDRVPEFVVGATNVYRTRDFIVRQKIGIRYDGEESNVVFSDDTFSGGLPSGTGSTRYCSAVAGT